jgi:hypothetical protein
MVFKLGMEAEKHWRRLNGPELVAEVKTGSNLSTGKNKPNRPPNQYFNKDAPRP